MYRMLHFVVVIAAAAVASLVVTAASRAAVPPRLNFQGILLDSAGATVPDATYELTFRILDAAVGGTILWDETQLLPTDNGLFNTSLGAVEPVPDSVFDGPNRWLELQLASSPAPYSPRSKLGSVGYAYRTNSVDGATGGNIYGDVTLHSTMAIGDATGNPGRLELTDGGQATIIADGTIPAIAIAGLQVALLDMSAEGDGSVVLPEGSISSTETGNEPGIAANRNGNAVALAQATGVMQDIVTVSITIPTSGYILLQSRTTLGAGGTEGRNKVSVQIDETPGGGSIPGYNTIAGSDGEEDDDDADNFIPIYTDRIYFKSAGAYTFRLEALAFAANCDHAVSRLSNSVITAIYFPTSYGAVAALVDRDSEPEFERAQPEVRTTYDGLEDVASTEQFYQVDLRELELKAARAEAEAERLHREVLEARLRQELEANP